MRVPMAYTWPDWLSTAASLLFSLSITSKLAPFGGVDCKWVRKRNKQSDLCVDIEHKKNSQ